MTRWKGNYDPNRIGGHWIYYDKAGQPIDYMEAARLRFAHEVDPENITEYARVGDDHVGEAWISTVWLGMDHNYCHHGPPLIFETMIFGGAYDDTVFRYATEAAAAEGHRRIVADLQAGRPPWFLSDDDYDG